MARAKKWAVEVEGVANMRRRFQTIAKTIDFERTPEARSIAETLIRTFAKAAESIRNDARLRAQTGNAPKRLSTGSSPAIFSYFDPDSSSSARRRRSALVGVRTGAPPRRDNRLYVEWAKGTRGISLGRLFERGTADRKIRPLRYFRNAIFASRGRVLTQLAAAYRQAAAALNSLRRT